MRDETFVYDYLEIRTSSRSYFLKPRDRISGHHFQSYGSRKLRMALLLDSKMRASFQMDLPPAQTNWEEFNMLPCI